MLTNYMAYRRKKYSGKKKFYKKAYSKRKYVKKAPVSRGANKLIPSINRGPEHKYNFQNLPDTRLNTVGLISLLNPLGQGNSDGTRVGDRVRQKMLDMRIRMYSVNPITIRVMLILDTRPAGSYPAILDILDGNDPQTGSSGIMSHRSKINLSRFVVLQDQFMTFNPQITGTVQEKFIHVYKKLNFGTDYSRGNAASVADIQTNALYLIAISNAINAATNPYLSYASKMTFTDD